MNEASATIEDLSSILCRGKCEGSPFVVDTERGERTDRAR